MNLDGYVAELRTQLASASASGGDETRALAEQLSFSLDAATRLVLLEALSEAAGEITRDLAPGSVELRLRGRDPEFAVSVPSAPSFVEHSAESERLAVVDSVCGSEPAVAKASTELEAKDDASTSRTTLRLPDQLKARVEKAAAQDGLSLNTWLVRAIGDALEPKARRGAGRESRSSNAFTGWAR
ncbi:toxin-antitoxin system HicB family antitoxin [Subtercola lobariae]|nr:toxin-antitoxin system HicB family antitoxin [Subtercola lobariae]